MFRQCVMHDRTMSRQERERKGFYPTPQIWVEKSQEYLAKSFGENWQEEYYIWDCCCGTGNLLAGLTNKYNIWASTLDAPDVAIVHDMITHGFNLLKSHVFQFDFLNDNFVQLPKDLQEIINDPQRRKRLIIFINPPYSEARGEKVGKSNKGGFHLSSLRDKYLDKIGKAGVEMFAQFAARVMFELPETKLGMFSTLKYVNSPNFEKFRQHFKAEYKGGFIVLANTFDNVFGNFPIGFLVWDFAKEKKYRSIKTDVFDKHNNNIGTKRFYRFSKKTLLLNDWVKTFPLAENPIATIIGPAADFQHQQNVWLIAPDTDSNWFHWQIGRENLVDSAIYFAVRHCIRHTWINHNDQLLFPDERYKKDRRFQNDCLIFTLFHEKNKIVSQGNANDWLPFSAREVNAQDNFRSAFMQEFLLRRGKFGKSATAVLEAGKTLWTYFHDVVRSDSKAFNDASLYEIREYFKGRKNGRVNTKSSDVMFTKLDGILKETMQQLAEEIRLGVYEYGFLLE